MCTHILLSMILRLKILSFMVEGSLARYVRFLQKLIKIVTKTFYKQQDIAPFFLSASIHLLFQAVYWGTATMIDAERRLLANALLDFSNQRFVLLSESCIPLFNFKTIYSHLMGSKQSFVGCFDDPRKPGRGRYNPKMFPTVTITDWRKGSQWFEVHRELAVHIVSDSKYYSIFKQYCLPSCYVDEHYIPTLVNILFPELNSNRSITWVDWSRGGPHPGKFGWGDITDEFLNRIRFGSTCFHNGNATSMCFLFARKFLPSALEPLLRVTPLLLGFDPY
jgi:hypothetical protein